MSEPRGEDSSSNFCERIANRRGSSALDAVESAGRLAMSFLREIAGYAPSRPLAVSSRDVHNDKKATTMPRRQVGRHKAARQID